MSPVLFTILLIQELSLLPVCSTVLIILELSLPLMISTVLMILELSMLPVLATQGITGYTGPNSFTKEPKYTKLLQS